MKYDKTINNWNGDNILERRMCQWRGYAIIISCHFVNTHVHMNIVYPTHPHTFFCVHVSIEPFVNVVWLWFVTNLVSNESPNVIVLKNPKMKGIRKCVIPFFAYKILQSNCCVPMVWPNFRSFNVKICWNRFSGIYWMTKAVVLIKLLFLFDFFCLLTFFLHFFLPFAFNFSGNWNRII